MLSEWSLQAVFPINTYCVKAAGQAERRQLTDLLRC